MSMPIAKPMSRCFASMTSQGLRELLRASNRPDADRALLPINNTSQTAIPLIPHDTNTHTHNGRHSLPLQRSALRRPLCA
jgi:hypothetical protein